jgi:hypothetical protein
MKDKINVDSTIAGIMNAQIKHGQYNSRDNECSNKTWTVQ